MPLAWKLLGRRRREEDVSTGEGEGICGHDFLIRLLLLHHSGGVFDDGDGVGVDIRSG